MGSLLRTDVPEEEKSIAVSLRSSQRSCFFGELCSRVKYREGHVYGAPSGKGRILGSVVRLQSRRNKCFDTWWAQQVNLETEAQIEG